MTTSDPSAAPLTLRFLGPVEVRVRDAPLPHLRTRKGAWLLALLTLRPDHQADRDWLAGTLWPDSFQFQALASLRMSLKDLRRALGPEAGRLYAPTPRSLALELAGAAVDLLAFDAAIASGDVTSLAEAVTVYRGPLLEGCGEAWVLAERQAREEACLGALETLAREALANGDAAAAERCLRRAVGVDPLRESAQRGLMALLAAGGSHAAALQVYRELRLQLHREINAAPDPETTALFQQLRAEVRGRTGRKAPGAPKARSERDVRVCR
jgi:DNA-binding SARP family transcriptional activator